MGNPGDSLSGKQDKVATPYDTPVQVRKLLTDLKPVPELDLAAACVEAEVSSAVRTFDPYQDLTSLLPPTRADDPVDYQRALQLHIYLHEEIERLEQTKFSEMLLKPLSCIWGRISINVFNRLKLIRDRYNNLCHQYNEFCKQLAKASRNESCQLSAKLYEIGVPLWSYTDEMIEIYLGQTKQSFSMHHALLSAIKNAIIVCSRQSYWRQLSAAIVPKADVMASVIIALALSDLKLSAAGAAAVQQRRDVAEPRSSLELTKMKRRYSRELFYPHLALWLITDTEPLVKHYLDKKGKQQRSFLYLLYAVMQWTSSRKEVHAKDDFCYRVLQTATLGVHISNNQSAEHTARVFVGREHLFTYHKNELQLATTRHSQCYRYGSGMSIFVAKMVNEHLVLTISHSRKAPMIGKFHHSTIAENKWMLPMGGELLVSFGQPVVITNGSGHYQFSLETTYLLLRYLQSCNIEVCNILLNLYTKSGEAYLTTGILFLNEFKATSTVKTYLRFTSSDGTTLSSEKVIRTLIELNEEGDRPIMISDCQDILKLGRGLLVPDVLGAKGAVEQSFRFHASQSRLDTQQVDDDVHCTHFSKVPAG